MSDLLRGGHAGESPYRYGPGMRYSFAGRYSDDCFRHLRVPGGPLPDRCAWSLEILRQRNKESERAREIIAMIEAAEARDEADARYLAMRRQAFAAILYGVVIIVLVIAAAGG